MLQLELKDHAILGIILIQRNSCVSVRLQIVMLYAVIQMEDMCTSK